MEVLDEVAVFGLHGECDDEFGIALVCCNILIDIIL